MKILVCRMPRGDEQDEEFEFGVEGRAPSKIKH